MRILLATPGLPPEEIGGVGLFALHLAQALCRRGHRVAMITGSEERLDGPSRIETSTAPPSAVTVHRLRLSRRHPRRAFLDRLAHPDAERLLAGLVRSLAPEVLHVHHTLNLSARLFALGLSSGAAVVGTVHDFWPLCQRIVLRRPDGALCPGPAGGWRCASCFEPPGGADAPQAPIRREPPRRSTLSGRALRLGRTVGRLLPFVLRTQLLQGAYDRSHRLTCPTACTAQLLREAGFAGDRLRLVDYGIPSLPAGVATHPRPRAPVRFGFLGTMGAHKGLALALQAAALLPPGLAQLTIHGGPLRDPELAARLDQAVREQRARYHGPYGAGELASVLTGLDALLIPSLWPETGPMVAMEAAAAGLPVIASRLGALAERLRRQEAGLLVPAGDPGALAAAMQAIARDYPRFRQEALSLPMRTVEDAAADFERVYQEAMAVARADGGHI